MTQRKQKGQDAAASLATPDRLPPTPPERLFTLEAIERAWRAVRRAGGGPGVASATLERFAAQATAELAALRQALVSGAYQPRPANSIFFPKPHGGLRPVAI